MTSDIYFFLECIPEGKQIYDCRFHSYESIRPIDENTMNKLRTTDARLFMRALADTEPKILVSHSKKEVRNLLEQLAENADTTADCAFVKHKDEIPLYCAVRDNIGQLLQYF